MSPILVRPVREQLEHDRVIRLLQQDLQKKKVEVGINPGYEQNAGVGSGPRKEFPDAVVYSLEKGKRVVAVVEVETGESVNDLEAKAQWAHLAKLRVPFHLYVPMGSVDAARRLSADNHISVSEIWSYHQVGEQFKFTLIHPPGAARGKGAQAPRTVSVSTIRVALPDPDVTPPVVEEKPPAPAAKSPRVIPPKADAPKAPRVIPAKVEAPKTPRVIPARTEPQKAPPVATAKTVGPARTVAPLKPAVPAKPAVKTKAVVPAKAPASVPKPAPKVSAKAAPIKPVSKAPVKPPAKLLARPVARAAKPAAKAAVKPAPKVTRPAVKAAARKPAGKRK